MTISTLNADDRFSLRINMCVFGHHFKFSSYQTKPIGKKNVSHNHIFIIIYYVVSLKCSQFFGCHLLHPSHLSYLIVVIRTVKHIVNIYIFLNFFVSLVIPYGHKTFLYVLFSCRCKLFYITNLMVWASFHLAAFAQSGRSFSRKIALDRWFPI